jgi:hypothetical protein
MHESDNSSAFQFFFADFFLIVQRLYVRKLGKKGEAGLQGFNDAYSRCSQLWQ